MKTNDEQLDRANEHPSDEQLEMNSSSLEAMEECEGIHGGSAIALLSGTDKPPESRTHEDVKLNVPPVHPPTTQSWPTLASDKIATDDNDDIRTESMQQRSENADNLPVVTSSEPTKSIENADMMEATQSSCNVKPSFQPSSDLIADEKAAYTEMLQTALPLPSNNDKPPVRHSSALIEDEKAAYKEMFQPAAPSVSNNDNQPPFQPSSARMVVDEKAAYKEMFEDTAAPSSLPRIDKPTTRSTSSSLIADEKAAYKDIVENSRPSSNVAIIPVRPASALMTDEKAAYREMFRAPPSPYLNDNGCNEDRKLPPKTTSHLNEKSPFYDDGDDAPRLQPSMPSHHLPSQTFGDDEKVAFRQDNDEKAAYRPGPALAIAPSSSSLDGPCIASAAERFAGPDLALSKSYDGISVAEGRTDLSSDELYAAAVATEITGLDAKDGDDGKNGKGGVATISPRRGQRVPRATAPGVEYIRRRAPGMRPSWYAERSSRANLMDLEQPVVEQSPGASDTTSNIPPAVPTRRLPALAEASWSIPKIHENRRWMMILLGITALVVIGVAVGVGIGVSSRDKNTTSSSTAAPQFAPYSYDCSALHDTANPHVLTQCYCAGNISIVPKEVAARYDILTQTFIAVEDPTFRPSIDSCSPQNQALLWLASSDGSTTASDTRTLAQRYRLALLFILWNGPSWTGDKGWLSSASECEWKGLSCDDQKQVTGMMLANSNITGELNLNITLLIAGLKKLDLSLNGIQASIPKAFGNHSSLTFLDLSSNLINGTLPTTLAMLTELRELRLSYNKIHGSIPTEWGLLHQLSVFDVSRNYLTGQIPTEIGLWQTSYLDWETNNFTTTLPTELGLISNLVALQVSSSGVYGSIPTELFFVNTKLNAFEASINDLTGTIPTQIGHATDLQKFFILENNITGTIPTEMGATAMALFYAERNQLSGTIPTELGRLSNLQLIALNGNPLNGTLPEELCFVPNRQICDSPTFHCWACSCQCDGE